jgi:hypothetical protein
MIDLHELLQSAPGIAGSITLVGATIVGFVLKARKVWSRDTRDIQYDDGQAAWVKGMQAEVLALRQEKDAMWVQRIEDIRTIAELKASDNYLRKQVSEMERKLDEMGTSLLQMRERLRQLERN